MMKILKYLLFLMFTMIIFFTSPVQAEECEKKCASYEHASVATYPWSWPNNEIGNYRHTFDIGGEKCTCECNEGYMWGLYTQNYETALPPQQIMMNCNKVNSMGSYYAGVDGPFVNTTINIPDEPGCPSDRRLGRDYCCLPGFEPSKTSGGGLICRKIDPGKIIKGRVYLDDEERAYPYGNVSNAKVELGYKGFYYTTFTDDGGFFNFTKVLEKEESVEIIVSLEYKDQLLQIMDGEVDENRPAWIQKTVSISDDNLKQGLEVNFDIKKNEEPIGYDTNTKNISKMIEKYLIFEDALDFALYGLRANIKEVNVVVKKNVSQNCDGGDACYNTTNKIIYLGSQPPITPDCEFHEFSHHIMFSQFEPNLPSGTKNHNGFLNPDTSDSMMEGEANFLALMALEHNRYQPGLPKKTKGVYYNKPYEVNYIAWQFENRVSYEEDAVSSLLWDLWDKKQDRLNSRYFFISIPKAYDNLSIPLSEIWGIIKSNTVTVNDLYNILIRTYPDKKQYINNTFVGHGFFKDRDRGNNQQDWAQNFSYKKKDGTILYSESDGEPFDDLNKNQIYDEGEPFVDLGMGHEFPGGQVYDAGIDEIGTASNYNRTTRKSVKLISGSYIKTKNVNNEKFHIEVTFFDPEDAEFNYDYETLAGDELLYVVFPPIEYQTRMNISPSTDQFEQEPPLSIDSQSYRRLLSEHRGRGYFMEHEFQLRTQSGARPSYSDSLFSELSEKINQLINPLIMVGSFVLIIFIALQFRKK